MKKFLISIVIIILIAALGFAIYTAVNHSTSSHKNDEQDNKTTHQKKTLNQQIKIMKIQENQTQIKMIIIVILAINSLHNQMDKIIKQQYHQILHLPNLTNHHQITMTHAVVVINQQRMNKIINNKVHLIIQIIAISLLSSHLKYSPLKIKY